MKLDAPAHQASIPYRAYSLQRLLSTTVRNDQAAIVGKLRFERAPMRSMSLTA
jgi:hypothetical protein